jgi:hypothetical protein
MDKLLFETWIYENDCWRKYGFRLSMRGALKAAIRLLDRGYDVEIRKYWFVHDYQ